MRLFRRAWNKYRSEGLSSTLGAAKQHWKPLFRRYLMRGRSGKYLFRGATAIRYRIQRVRYAAPAHPDRRLSVDPQEITHVGGHQFDRALGLGQLADGEWDCPRYMDALEDDWIYSGLRQRFEDGYEWTETVYYKKIRERFDNGESVWDYDNITEFRRVRCNYLDGLFRSIRDEGYRLNTGRQHDVPAEDDRYDRYDQQLEPLVTIGRHGDVFLRDGRHRVAITRILGLESIPVHVLGRHRKWQQVRDEVDRADTLSDLDSEYHGYLGHPDLDDVRPD